MSGFSGRLFIMQMLQVVFHYAAVTRQTRFFDLHLSMGNRRAVYVPKCTSLAWLCSEACLPCRRIIYGCCLCCNRNRRMKSLSAFTHHHAFPDFLHCGNQKENFPGHSFACNESKWQLKVCSHQHKCSHETSV